MCKKKPTLFACDYCARGMDCKIATVLAVKFNPRKVRTAWETQLRRSDISESFRAAIYLTELPGKTSCFADSDGTVECHPS
jgi:hypothetical protein